MNDSEVLGLDVGIKRTGIARGSMLARISEPLITVPTEEAPNKIKELIEKYKSSMLVVGLPRSLEGNETEQTEWVKSWVEDLKQQLDVPIYVQDEALTTKIAESEYKDSKHDVDSIAAAIILQDFLNLEKSERVVW